MNYLRKNYDELGYKEVISPNLYNKKIFFNYIFVIGEKEEKENSINVRSNNENLGLMSIQEMIDICENKSKLD